MCTLYYVFTLYIVLHFLNTIDPYNAVLMWIHVTQRKLRQCSYNMYLGTHKYN